MSKIGIVSAMPVELEGSIEKFAAKEVDTKGFYKVYQGHFAGHTVYMACNGIGKVNAAACTQKLIDCFDVDFIVNMGIAGGIAKDLKTLDVVIGSDVLYHDFHPLALFGKYFPFRQAFSCDEKLIQIAEAVCKETPEVRSYKVARIATGDCFVEDSKTKAYIRDELGGTCCEMEGAAIGHVAAIAGVPFVVVRTISDLADEGAQETYADFEQKASLQSNRIVEGILKRL